MTDLLPIPYFHIVLTIPADVNPLVLRNKKVILTIQGQVHVLLTKECRKGNVHFSGEIQHLENPGEFQKLVDKLYDQNWVVYSKAPRKVADQGDMARIVATFKGRGYHHLPLLSERKNGSNKNTTLRKSKNRSSIGFHTRDLST